MTRSAEPTLPSFEEVTKKFWARDDASARAIARWPWLAELEALAESLESEYLEPERPTLTLIQGGLSPIGDTGSDDVAC